MEIKSNLKTLAIVGALSSATTLGAYKLFLEKSPSDTVFTTTPSAFTRLVSNVAPSAPGNPGDFTYAADSGYFLSLSPWKPGCRTCMKKFAKLSKSSCCQTSCGWRWHCAHSSRKPRKACAICSVPETPADARRCQ